MQTGAWRVSYIPGSWLVLSGPTSLVILQPASPQWSDLVRTIWEDVLASASIHDLAARMSAFSLDEMPSFGAFFWTGDQMRSLVRGDVVLTDPATGQTVGSGADVLTWTEVGLAGLPRVRVDLGPVEAEPMVLPLVVGVVSAGGLLLDTTVNAPLAQGTVPIATSGPVAEATSEAVTDESTADQTPDRTTPGPSVPDQATPDPSAQDGAAADAAAELDETSNEESSNDETGNDETGDTVLAPIVVPEPQPTRPDDSPFTAEEGETEAPEAELRPGPTRADTEQAVAEHAAEPMAARAADQVADSSSATGSDTDTEDEDDDWEDTQFDLPAVPADPTAPMPVVTNDPTARSATPRSATPQAPTPQAPTPAAPVPRTAPPEGPAAAEPPAPVRRVLAVLRVSTGGRADVDRPVLIGRSPTASRVTGDQLPRLLTVPSPSHDISRTHLQIAPEDGRLVVTDLKSTNGTVLIRPGSKPQDLQPGRPETIEPGCRLDLGDGVVIAVDRP